ncbi:26780_t:CDS:2 [Gigaspora margarita]|uniref:26780_t:CDS:1 n=1 Tax=Gigaspora margarita TaxID=4874 RepID=A0ABN7VLE0_GIGMA|nr:26780_t:CDS:2 [Gigaspora margarita]
MNQPTNQTFGVQGENNNRQLRKPQNTDRHAPRPQNTPNLFNDTFTAVQQNNDLVKVSNPFCSTAKYWSATKNQQFWWYTNAGGLHQRTLNIGTQSLRSQNALNIFTDDFIYVQRYNDLAGGTYPFTRSQDAEIYHHRVPKLQHC